MGLDMYLYAEKNVSAYDYEYDGKEHVRRDNLEYDKILQASGLDSLPSSENGMVIVAKQIAYWRKANAIHGWFVRELANGKDECQRISVSREDLINLRNDCVNVLSKRNEAVPTTNTNVYEIADLGNSEDVVSKMLRTMKEESDKLSTNVDTIVREDSESRLEPTSGFFFGNTDKDEWYYKTLEYTIDVINSMLANDSDLDYEYYYRASW
jgi:hypothetical protein